MQDQMNRYYLGLGILSLIYFVAIVYGFSVIGSPFSTRRKKLDMVKINDLKKIKNEIHSYYSKEKKLPTNLNVLKQSLNLSGLNIEEINNQSSYGYSRKSDYEYELCALFSSSYSDNINEYMTIYDSDFKNFSEGYYCFQLKVPDYLKVKATPTFAPRLIFATPTPRVFFSPCGQYKTLEECDSAPKTYELDCAWYICKNVCLTRGTSIEEVCSSKSVVVIE